MQRKLSALLISSLLGSTILPVHAQLFDSFATPESSEASDNKTAAKTTASQNAMTATLLASYIDETKTLKGTFEQIVYSGRGEEISSGTFSLKRPGMFDWQYEMPSAQRIISNGNKVYHYDQDLEQITIRPRSELAGDVAMNLLVGDQKLAQSFSVTATGLEQVPSRLRNDDPNLTFYQLKPKQAGDEVDQVWVVMNGDTLAAVYVDTGVGQQSLIVLRQVERNVSLADASFTFTPPPGVDVIGE